MKIFKYTKESNKQAHTYYLCFMIVYRVPYLIYVYFANYCKLGMCTSLVVHWLRLCASKTAPWPQHLKRKSRVLHSVAPAIVSRLP